MIIFWANPYFIAIYGRQTPMWTTVTLTSHGCQSFSNHGQLDRLSHSLFNPDSKVHGANMGPTWVLSAPDGPHVGPMNLAIKEANKKENIKALHYWMLCKRNPTLDSPHKRLCNAESVSMSWCHHVLFLEVLFAPHCCNDGTMLVAMCLIPPVTGLFSP